jgi:dihydrofolate reductase
MLSLDTATFLHDPRPCDHQQFLPSALPSRNLPRGKLPDNWSISGLSVRQCGESQWKIDWPRRLAMRKLKIIEHISLDGVVQISDEDDVFPFGTWTAPYRTPAGRDAILAAHGESFDLLLGRRTYDDWSGSWANAPSSPLADRLKAAKKYVATRRPESLEWGPYEAVVPDIVAGIRRIKAQDGPDLILSGSITLASTVLEHGLADEVILPIYPVVLGKGRRLFADGTPPRSLELVSAQPMPSGIIFCTYTVAGPLKSQS